MHKINQLLEHHTRCNKIGQNKRNIVPSESRESRVSRSRHCDPINPRGPHRAGSRGAREVHATHDRQSIHGSLQCSSNKRNERSVVAVSLVLRPGLSILLFLIDISRIGIFRMLLLFKYLFFVMTLVKFIFQSNKMQFNFEGNVIYFICYRKCGCIISSLIINYSRYKFCLLKSSYYSHPFINCNVCCLTHIGGNSYVSTKKIVIETKHKFGKQKFCRALLCYISKYCCLLANLSKLQS